MAAGVTGIPLFRVRISNGRGDRDGIENESWQDFGERGGPAVVENRTGVPNLIKIDQRAKQILNPKKTRGTPNCP